MTDKIPIGTLCFVLPPSNVAWCTCIVVGHMEAEEMIWCQRKRRVIRLANPHDIEFTSKEIQRGGPWAYDRSQLLPISPDATIREEEREAAF